MSGPWGTRLRRAAIGSSLLALACAGGLAGWALRGWSETDQAPVVVSRPVTVIEDAGPAGGTMPGLLGLDAAGARQVLADAGVDPADVAIRRQPFVGEPGTVVDQAPAPTTPVPRDGDVTLYLSKPATMPALQGATAEQARDALGELGATVTTTSRFQPGAPEDEVLDTVPAVGAAIDRGATLVLAEAPSSVFLAKLESVDGDCGTETVPLDGIERDEALVCEPSAAGAAMEYQLNRRISTFRATVGVGDRSPSASRIAFRVVVDGRQADVRTLSLGEAEQVAVPVYGALRLRLEASETSVATGGREAATAVWADAALVGGRPAVDALSGADGP